jgi:hypothetical protein
MSKTFEERTCIVCGKKWTVEVRPRNKGKLKRCMCDNCLKSMTPAEKQKYYRQHEGKAILEERECLNCGHKWLVDVKINKVGELSKMRYFCNDCNNLLTNWQKRAIMMEKIDGFKEKVQQDKRESRLRNIIHSIWKKAKDRAIKHGLDFNIEESDIIIPEICPILEVPLEFGTKGSYEHTPSLDRIDNSKGYVKDNVWIISKKANSMKNSATPEELSTFCRNIQKYNLNGNKAELL